MRSTTLEPLFAAPSMADTAADIAQTARTAPAKSALWSKLYAGLIEARQAQANAIVAQHLALYDDTSLTSLGWTATEIDALRRRTAATAR
jgi:hypothetical protein